MGPWRFIQVGISEMLQIARIPSVALSSPVGWLQEAPYRKTREHGSKDGCLGAQPRIPIVS